MGLNAVMAAVILASTFSAQDVQALALGRLTVQSALGEPLVAEIDVPEITAAEANSLRVSLAPPQVYRAAGVDMNPTLANTDIRLLRRPDGRAFLRITNPRTINEPYLDLMLEANWASGRIVRDYTLLLDPPNLRGPAPAPLPSPVAASITPPAPAPTAPTPAPTPAPAPAPAPAPVPAAPAPAVATPSPPSAPAPEPAPRPAPPVAPAAAPVPSRDPVVARPLPPTAAPKATPATPRTPPVAKVDRLTVKSGDTAGRIAQAHRPANASLEQMLVAMLKANPDVFINGNVNLIKAGAIIDLPDDKAATATPDEDAKQTVSAQSRDFNNFRQRLASAARAVAPTAPERNTAGKVQAEVKDQRPAAQAADQLKLTKGAVSGQPAAPAEDQIAKARQAKEAADRTAELQRNIAELSKLDAAAAAAPTTPAQPAVTPATPAVTVAAAPPAAEPTAATAATADMPPATDATKTEDKPAADAPPTDATASPAAQATTEAAAPPPIPPAEAAPPEASLLDSVLDNPLALPAAGGLLALLLGFGAYRIRQRKKLSGVDSSYLESRLQPDSFFGASGGQKVDTAEAVPTGSSMMYSPSQLDVGGDVDPVAEADVYLAYGRDLQAEEILKEAMRITPSRVAIHAKMLEIYAKRRDAKAFEVLACEVYALTHGTGPEWEHACTLGQELDPANPLYQPGGSPAALAPASTVAHDVTPGMAVTQPFDEPLVAQVSADGPLDLDLDFSIDSPAADQATPTDAADAPSFDVAQAPAEDPGLTFELDEPDAAPTPPPTAADSPAFDLNADDLSFDLPDAAPPTTDSLTEADLDLSLDLPDAPAAEPPPPEPTTRMAAAEASPPTADDNLMSFDMDDISLDLGDTTGADTTLDDIPDGDPLETKLSLAAEFQAIGDEEGARSLAEEVLEQATGPLKAKASSFLANLG
ncbi:MAG: fimbrial protein FimV [Polaromonas sp.]|nr:fimbrial protein FimV [Polaromonas sp.]